MKGTREIVSTWKTTRKTGKSIHLSQYLKSRTLCCCYDRFNVLKSKFQVEMTHNGYTFNVNFFKGRRLRMQPRCHMGPVSNQRSQLKTATFCSESYIFIYIYCLYLYNIKCLLCTANLTMLIFNGSL